MHSMTHPAPVRRTSSRALAAVVALVLALGGLGLLGIARAPFAGAAPTAASDGTLDWAVSANAFNSGSLGATKAAEGNATLGAGNWSFSGGTGTYDADTGALSVSYSGALSMGNTAQGNYGIRISDPTITVDADGAGTIVAGVATRFSGPTFATPTAGVTVATFTLPDGDVSLAGLHASFTVTPDFVGTVGSRQFPQSYLDAIPGLETHFKESGAGSDVNKPPAPVTVSFDFEAPAPVWNAALTPATTTDLVAAGETVTVTGSGYDPAAHLGVSPPLAGQPSGFYVAFGKYADVWQPSTGALAATRQNIDAVWVLPAAQRAMFDPTSDPDSGFATLNPDGTFSATLDVHADAALTNPHYGFVTYPASGANDPTQERFVAASFAAVVDPEPEPEPEPNPVTGGGLDWGVKASFRSYILGPIAQGTVTTAGGATTNPNGTFNFPAIAGATEATAERIDAAFAGSVNFSGHGGTLDLTISDIHVVSEGTTGVLIADVESAELEETGIAAVYDDVELVTLDLTGSGPVVVGNRLVWTNIQTVLAAGGAPAFSGFYTEGTAFDDATISLGFEHTPEGGVPGTNPDVVTLDATTVKPGDKLTATAGGYTPGEQVEVWVHSVPQFVGSTVAGSDGVVTFTFTVPNVDPGQHRVEIRGITSGRSLFSAPFTVTAVISPGSLAFTGSDMTGIGIGAVVALLLGLVLLLGARTRRSATTS